jgi:hypothetical protein
LAIGTFQSFYLIFVLEPCFNISYYGNLSFGVGISRVVVIKLYNFVIIYYYFHLFIYLEYEVAWHFFRGTTSSQCLHIR